MTDGRSLVGPVADPESFQGEGWFAPFPSKKGEVGGEEPRNDKNDPFKQYLTRGGGAILVILHLDQPLSGGILKL